MSSPNAEMTTTFSGSWKYYASLGAVLFVGTFGFHGIVVALSCSICFVVGFIFMVLKKSKDHVELMKKEFSKVTEEHRFAHGIQEFISNRQRFTDKSMYEQTHSMTKSSLVDPILEEVLGLVMRDFVETWYSELSNDQLFKESLKRTARRSIGRLSHSVQKVDWVPLLTHDIMDDLASHLRLYRKAKERCATRKEHTEEDLESDFFDLELEMEKTYCRDLVSTTPQYENAYLHDICDILLYLLMPSEDFRSRPLRFILREIIVRKVIMPLLDKFSDPDYLNHIIVWLLSSVSLGTDDFITMVELSDNCHELEALLEALQEEMCSIRGRDSGGEEAAMGKQQLGSLEHLENVIKRRMTRLTTASNGPRDGGILKNDESGTQLIQLPIVVVFTNSQAVRYFIEFLSANGGQSYIDCYLAIEGFKVSVEHQLRGLSNGETIDSEVYETIKEAAVFMYHQYLSQEAVTRVNIDDSIINKFLATMRNDESYDLWFDQIQNEIVNILNTDERFYPAFKKDPAYIDMLTSLGIIGEDYESGTDEENASQSSRSVDLSHSSSFNILPSSSSSNSISSEAPMSISVETLGIGQQAKQTFALYNVRVTRKGGPTSSTWNVIRRYSDFHTLHSLIVTKFPHLSSISFPGKKTFNNLDQGFLEKRTLALNHYMTALVNPNVLKATPELESVVLDFLSQKQYVGSREGIHKKVMNAMFDGVKAFGSAVTAVPDQVFDGVSKGVNGLNRAANQVLMKVLFLSYYLIKLCI
uniref:Sorting nexin-13 n=1 Tax=Steinernema glaseri TaxID=37863 RepID=A0A1I7Y8Q8_9BILA